MPTVSIYTDPAMTAIDFEGIYPRAMRNLADNPAKMVDQLTVVLANTLGGIIRFSQSITRVK